MPPEGLDVRLSLDLPLQRAADLALDGQTGALVLLNARSGEILALATSPTFDANTLAQYWQSLVSDPSAPLFNRAADGLYPPGAALGVFLLAETTQSSSLPALPATMGYTLGETRLSCALPSAATAWGAAIVSGCPAPSAALADALGPAGLLGMIDRLGLFTAPELLLPTQAGLRPAAMTNAALVLFSQADPSTGSALAATPLQMALAAAVLSNQGLRPAPLLVMAVDTPQSGWVMLPALATPVEIFSAQAARSTARQLADPDLPIWQTTACVVYSESDGVCWYLGGTLDTWPGAPLAVAILLENAPPSLVAAIGRGYLETALIP